MEIFSDFSCLSHQFQNSSAKVAKTRAKTAQNPDDPETHIPDWIIQFD